jgi:hypothetical protein
MTTVETRRVDEKNAGDNVAKSPERIVTLSDTEIETVQEVQCLKKDFK